MNNRIPTLLLAALSVLGTQAGCSSSPLHDSAALPYLIEVPSESRSISFENPGGAKGQGGMAAHPTLGPGRKGAPLKTFKPGEQEVLCDIEGPGVIRHVWMTTNNSRKALLRQIIRVYWEGQEHPSIEVPIGNFFGLSYGIVDPYESVAHAVNPNAGMNLNLPMPFAKRARITLTNESYEDLTIYYSIDYTMNDSLPRAFGRLHILYRRETPTIAAQDFEILPLRTGSGRFLGCVLGIRPVEDGWWGEGEFKVYLDGDREWPTIVGTGTEDYNLQSYGIQDRKYLYAGTNLMHFGLYSIYRWHWQDPIYWKKDIRVTIQQMGYYPGDMYNRHDDWSATTFWYEAIPSAPLPPMPDPFGEDPKTADHILDWLALGPFRDEEADIKQRMEKEHVATGALRPAVEASEGNRRWERVEARSSSDLFSDRPLGVDLLQQLYGPRERSSVYLHQYVFSPKPQNVPLRLFSSDGCKVWLNRKEVFRSRELHRFYMMETCEVPLVEGWNSLLMKVLQGRIGWAFAARIDNRENLGIAFAPELPPSS